LADCDNNSRDAHIAALEAALSAERAARVAAERELAASRERLHDSTRREQDAIVRIARLSAGRADFDLGDMLAELTEAAAATLHVDRTSVWLLGDDRKSLHCLDLYELGRATHSKGVILIADNYPDYFQALETGRAIDAHDARTDPRTCEFRDGYLVPLGITSMMDAAIRVNGEVIGAVCHEHVGAPRVWAPTEIHFAGALADQVALVLSAVERRRLQEEANAARHELRAAQELAQLDELTRLFNRRAMEHMLVDEVARAQRYDRPLSLAMVDLDHFKTVNDRCGHRAGDHVLREVASLVLSGLRATDRAARYGGEELCLIFPETGCDEAYALVERLRRSIDEHMFSAGRSDGNPVELRLTVSIGLAELGEHTNSAEQLIVAADHALYVAKAAGRNCVIRAAGLPATAPSESASTAPPS
jgi:diguanylate cyclase (GGDEF)-like protein